MSYTHGHDGDDDATIERVGAAGPKASHFEFVQKKKKKISKQANEDEYVLVVTGC